MHRCELVFSALQFLLEECCGFGFAPVAGPLVLGASFVFLSFRSLVVVEAHMNILMAPKIL